MEPCCPSWFVFDVAHGFVSFAYMHTAIPHRLIEDDVHEGYYMPKGALVFANTWSIMHDENMYPDPFTFNPERYNTTSLEKGLNLDPAQFAFGYGRR